MSLGFKNTEFPTMVTLDKLGSYYDSSEIYNTATTASLSVSQSFASSIATSGGTATSALASNGNLGFCFEQASSMTVVEGLGGTSTTVALGSTQPKRGMVYDPKNDKFILFGTEIKIVNATSPHTVTTVTNPYLGQNIWGGVVVDGRVYFAPYTGNGTQIAVLDVDSGTAGLTGVDWGFNQSQFMSPTITRYGQLIWGGEGDSTIKQWDFKTQSLLTIPSSIQYSGYQGWAPLNGGTLFNAGWNSSQFQTFQIGPNDETGTITKTNKSDTNQGPWSNVFQGLDGKGYIVDSKGVNQLGATYSDIFCYDPDINSFFKTQFKMPAHSTSGDRQNQAILVQPDGWVVSAGQGVDTEYHAVKMFEPNNTITNGSRTAGFTPNTAN